jgi:6-phosphogluconolactonase (cycloisomerase 2 family)
MTRALGIALFVAALSPGAARAQQADVIVDGSIEAPTSAAVSPDGAHVYVAGDGGIVALARDATTGALSEVQAPVPHSGNYGFTTVVVSGDGEHVYGVGTPLNSERLTTFSRDLSTGELTEVAWAAPPRDSDHFALSADGAFAWLTSTFSSTLSRYSRDSGTGALSLIDSLTPGDIGGAGLTNAQRPVLSPDGAHLYVTSSGDSKLSVFSVNASTGALTFVESQDVPNIQAYPVTLSPDGAFLYAPDVAANTLRVFARNSTSGALTLAQTYVDDSNLVGLGGPQAAFVPADGATLYLTTTEGLSTYARNAGTGLLTFTEEQVEDATHVGVAGWPIAAVPGADDFYVVKTDDDALARLRHGAGGGTAAYGEPYYGDDALPWLGYQEVLSRFTPIGDRLVHVARDGDYFIGSFTVDPDTGAITPVDGGRLADFGSSATFFVPTGDISPDGKFFAGKGRSGNALASFALGAAAELSLLTDVSYNGDPVVTRYSPDGEHLYAGTWSDAISVFDHDPATGALTFLPPLTYNGAVDPLDFEFSADGTHLYAATPSGIQLLHRNPTTGELSAGPLVAQTQVQDIGLDPTGAHLYATMNLPTSSGFQFAVYDRNATTGELTLAYELDGGAVPAGIAPTGVGGSLEILGWRGLAFTPDGQRVVAGARMSASNISGLRSAMVLFARDTTTGELTWLDSWASGFEGVVGALGGYGLATTSNGKFAVSGNTQVISTLDIEPFVPPPLVARDDDARALVNEAVVVDLLANDDFGDGAVTGVDYASALSTSAPGGYGVSESADLPGGTFELTLTHPADWVGTYSFDYTVSDTYGAMATATVVVTVTSSLVVEAEILPPTNVWVPEDETEEPTLADLLESALDDYTVTLPDGTVSYDFSRVCEDPTLEQCQSALLPEICGGRVPACTPHFLATTTQFRADHPEEPVPFAERDYLTTAHIAVDAPDLYAVIAPETLYGGDVMNSVRAQRAASAAAAVELDAEHTAWVDSCIIESCEEYVFDKYFDYEVFEQLAAQLGDDYRAIVALAYDPVDGIAYDAQSQPKVLRQRDGAVSTQLRWPLGQPYKNAYFSFNPREAIRSGRLVNLTAVNDILSFELPSDASTAPAYEQEFEFYDWESVDYSQGGALLDHLENTPLGPPRNWDTHLAASTALSGESDRLLYELRHVQERFSGLLEGRKALYDKLLGHMFQISLITNSYYGDDLELIADYLDRHAQQGPPLGQPPSVDLLNVDEREEELIREQRGFIVDTMTDLHEIELAIADELALAEELGCLDTSVSWTPCDWSPRELAEYVQGQLLAEREADYQRCLDYTGGSFTFAADSRWLVEQAAPGVLGDFCGIGPSRRCVLRETYVSSPTHLEQYFDALDAWREALALPVDPETGEVYVGQQASDVGGESSGHFGVDWDYAFAWSARDIDEGQCSTDVTISSTIGVDAKVFGYSTERLGVPLFDADLTLRAHDDVAEPSLTMRALGVEFYKPDVYAGPPPSIHIVQSPAKRIEPVPSQGTTILVAGIPVVIKGGVAGTIGVDMSLTAAAVSCAQEDPVDEGLKVDGVFSVTPFAGVDVWAAAGVDVVVASAYVRADVNLVTFRLPFDVVVGVDVRPPDSTLLAKAALGAEISTLSGRITLIIDYVLDEYRRTLFSWSGLSWDFDLLDFEFTYLLDPLAQILGDDLRGDVTPVGVTGDECLNTCVDGMQNNGETGVDCGGGCVNECPVCESGTNLLSNGSFESVPGDRQQAAELPDGWQAPAGSEPTVYSDDDTWGVFPAADGAFRGLFAFEGHNFVAAAAASGHLLAQQLGAPLSAGTEYRVRARLLEAVRVDVDQPGGYRVYLSPDGTLSGATQVGALTDTLDANDLHAWEGRSFTFSAPGNASSLGYLVFEPTAAYPALDDVVLAATVACQ